MSGATASFAVFGAGIAALAGLLFLLHRLRVRHREVEVVTTLFWRQALEETRARVLVQRFRHPWIYVLLLAIGSLLWWSIVRPEFRAADAGAIEHLLLVDGSASMAIGERFPSAFAAARERAVELPRRSTRIMLATARLDTLLDHGEELPDFDLRSAECTPDAVPSSLSRAILGLAANRRDGEPTLAIETFSVLPLDPALSGLLPPGVSVTRRPCGLSAAANPHPDNAGIVALGLSEAASGAYDTVDVFLAVAGSGESPHVELDGAPLAPGEPRVSEDGATQWICRDVPARGGELEARLPGGDALALDDIAGCVLPNRPLLRVIASDSLPAAFLEVLRADPGVVLVNERAMLAVRRAGEAIGGELPAIEIAAESDPENGANDDSTAAFIVRDPAIVDAERSIRDAFLGLGLRDVDALDLATQTGRPIELSLEAGAIRSLAIRADLLDARHDFIASPAFPTFVATALRWLARSESVTPVVAAGEVIAVAHTPWQNRGCAVEPLANELRIPRALTATTADGRRVRASLLDLRSAMTRLADVPPPPASDGQPELDLRFLVALAALLLLVLEWWLVRTERAP